MKKNFSGRTVLFVAVVITMLTAGIAPALASWKLVKTEVNPNEVPLEYYGGGSTPGFYTDPRYEGKSRVYTINETSFSIHDVEMDHGYLYYDITLTTSFDAPLSDLVPGATITLNATCSHSGTVNDGSPGLLFEYRVDGASISPSSAFGYSPWNPEFTGVNSTSYSFSVPNTHSGQIVVSAFWWNAGMAQVVWTYEAEQEETTTTTTAAVSSTTTIPDVIPALKLTYPFGYSPRIFTSGWVLGAECTYIDSAGSTVDISDRVVWGGRAVRYPRRMGSRNSPFFAEDGENLIELSVILNGKKYSKEFTVQTVHTTEYARLTDRSLVPADAHGCLSCPHSAVGPIITGSPTIFIEGGLPAARVGDDGIHLSCCNASQYCIASGDPTVLIDGRPAARVGDKTQHCGGVGMIFEGSPGDKGLFRKDERVHKKHRIDTGSVCRISPRQQASASGSGSIAGTVSDASGSGIYGVGVNAYTSDNIWGTITDESGAYTITDLPAGDYTVHFWGGNTDYNSGFSSCWYNATDSRAAADTVSVSGDESVTGIDATLARAASISGRVKDGSGTGIAGIKIKAFDARNTVTWGATDSDGTYAIAGLAAGSYRLWCDASAEGFLGIWYGGAALKNDSTPVSVTDTAVTGIDFSIDAAGTLSGSVTDQSGTGIEDVVVSAYGNSTGAAAMGMTGENGAYSIKGLLSDSYRIYFQGAAAGYRSIWYQDADSWDSASLVAVAEPNTTSGVDAQLAKGCPLTMVMQNAQHLNVLRILRDGPLSKLSDLNFVARYYAHEKEISAILAAHPQLRTRLRRLVLRSLPAVIALNRTGSARLHRDSVTEIEALLSDLRVQAHPALQRTIDSLSLELKQGTLWKRLGVEISRINQQ